MSRIIDAVEDRLAVGTSQINIGHRVARNVLLGGSDAVMLSLAVAIAFVSWAAPIRDQPAEIYFALAPLIVIFIAGYAKAGLYPSLGLGPVQTLRRLSYVTTFGFLMVAAFSFVLKLPPTYSRVTFLIALGLSLALVPLGRVVLFSVAQRWLWWAEPVVVIGTGRRAIRAIRGIKQARYLGYRPVAVIQSDARHASRDAVDGVPVVGGLDQVPAVSASGVHVAFVEIESLQTPAVLDRLQRCFRHVVVLKETDDLPVEGLQVRSLGGLIGIEYTNNLLRPVNQTAKRLLDLVLGISAFVLLAPLIAAGALLVLLIDGGPAFFHQSRVGFGGRRINVPKIRTMRRDADNQLEEHFHANPALRDEWKIRFKLSEDPRLIPVVGRFFRRFSIDELPQLWPVIRGHMSLVGPRPFPDYHVEQFAPKFSELRQSVRPGITGWWQVAVRSDGGIKEQEAFDTYYIRNWSVWFDLYVLARTVVAVVSGRGAYIGPLAAVLKKVADNRNPDSLAARLRRKRFSLFVELLGRIPGDIRVLDVGGTPEFWRIMGFDDSHVHVTLMNRSTLDCGSGPMRSILGDARDMRGLRDHEFDVVFSNSVIEHVGSFADQAAMASEVRRVGRRYFVQTPNKYFPIEPHFLVPGFQFLPLGVRARLHARRDLGWWKKAASYEAALAEVSTIRLLTERDFRKLFPEARVFKERFCGLTKSFIAHHGW